MEQKTGRSNKTHWLGWALTALPALMFLMSATMKFMGTAQVLQMFNLLGWQANDLLPLGVLELSCVVLYLIPQVSVLGAIVLTGYLGGAIATEVRVGHPIYMHIVIGLLIWGGLYLRESRLRALLPFRSAI
ncbi:MAG TPA: DoxX family protein [bacterium]|jgi:hypothetical protein|nr:DoxX family protein [bacterium]